MNPIKNVNDPHSISATDIPSSSDANPAGVISGDRRHVDADGGTGTTAAGRPSERDSGVRRRLKTRADSSQKTRDCWSSCLLIMSFVLVLVFFLVLPENPREKRIKRAITCVREINFNLNKKGEMVNVRFCFVLFCLLISLSFTFVNCNCNAWT